MHGQLGEEDLPKTIYPMIYFALGIPALAAIEILSRAYYALQDARTAVIISIVELFFVVALSVILLQPFGAVGVALAQSIGITGEAITLLMLLRKKRRLDDFSVRPLVNFIFGVLAASLVAVLVLKLIITLLAVGFQDIYPVGSISGVTVELVLLAELAVSGGSGALVYYMAARFLGIADTVPVASLFARFGGRRKRK